MPDLWTRIRKARLFRVLVVYVAVSWVVLQVADVLEDTLELPDWVAAALLLLLLAGGLIVLATAWLQAHPPAAPEADGRVTRGERVMHRWVLPQLTWPRAIAGGVLAIALLALVTFVVVQRRLPGVGPREARADEAGVGLAVLPFHVSGPDAELWREGMLDLLATSLDGVGGLRTIDPATILARTGNGSLDEAAGLQVARDVRARYALLGSAVGLVSTVRLTAEVHDLELDSVVARARVEGPQDSVLPLVDALSVDLVRQLVSAGARETGLRNAQTITTTSLPALRAYLEGERLYRRGDLDGAAAAYERAVRDDSTFALAWWGLAWSRGWVADVAMQELSDSAYARVIAHADRLPERTRMFVRGDSLRRAGDARSTAVFESAVRRYPDDPEAWYMLGEVRFHAGWAANPPLDDVIEPFRRAVALDPSAGTYYYHLVETLIGVGDTIEADSLIPRFEAYTGDSARADAWRLARVVLTPPLALDADAVRRHLDDASADAIQHIINAGMFTGSYPAALEGMAMAGMRAGMSPADMAGAPIVSRLEQGKLQEVVALALSGVLPPGQVPPLLAFAHHLGASIPEPLLARHLDPRAGELSFWSGVHAWLSEDARGVQQAAATLDSVAASGTSRLPADVLQVQADALGAFAVALRGDARTAADSLHDVLRRAEVAPSLEAGLAISMMRMQLGELYLASDRPREALAIVEGRYPARPAPVLARHLARIHDALGQPERAATYYAIFLEGWRNADPGLAWKTHAEQRLARIAAE